jgi:hypothetical protein
MTGKANLCHGRLGSYNGRCARAVYVACLSAWLVMIHIGVCAALQAVITARGLSM